MNFLNTAQEIAWHRAVQQNYKAVAFDVDGTLTPFCSWVIPQSLRETLRALPADLSLALCSGRSFEYVQHVLDEIFEDEDKDAIEEQRKRWFLICENGGVGYVYNERTKDYEVFFEVPWPSHLDQEGLEACIKDRFGWHVLFVTRVHSIVVRFHDWVYFFPRMVAWISKRTGVKIRRLFKKLGHDSFFKVEDSGVGNLVIPIQSGKAHAVSRWAKKLGLQFEEILVMGDQPGPGGNDEAFLSGGYGTAFTVGAQTSGIFPLPVLDAQHRKLHGPEATEQLLRLIFR